MENFKISLKAARVNAEMTQEEVANLMGKNKQTIVNWETGKTEIGFGDVLKLCRLYHVPIERIKYPEYETQRQPDKGSPSVKDPRYAVQNPKKAGRR